MTRERMTQLLDAEISRHISLALASMEPVMIHSHLEVIQALMQAERLLERRNSQCKATSVWGPAVALCRQHFCRIRQYIRTGTHTER